MALIGKSDFRGGVTLLDRLPENAPAIMRRISGWRIDRGALTPEGVVAKLNTGAALGATLPEQVPIVFRQPNGVRALLARDANYKVCEFPIDPIGGSWADPGPVIAALPESVALAEFAAGKDLLNDPAIAQLVSALVDAEAAAAKARALAAPMPLPPP